jgi:8-oxo-dGTP diphosphatase
MDYEYQQFVNWGDHRIRLSWIPLHTEIPEYIVTSAHALCFYENRLLLVDINTRGFDIVGGHVEEGETTEQACLREVYEEGYVKGDATFIGYLEVNHCENIHWTPNSKYPKIAYQAYYKVDITEIMPFDAGFETSKRMFVDMDQFSNFYHNKDNAQVIQAILASIV